jgi:hypothetical protein
MQVSQEYINKALGDLPNKRETHERSASFIKGELRNDDNPNDAFATKVLTNPKETP